MPEGPTDDLFAATDREHDQAAVSRGDLAGWLQGRIVSDRPRGYASPPCLAHEVDPTYFDPLATDPQQAADVARWRRSERRRLLDARATRSVAAREQAARIIAETLDALLAERIGPLEGRVVAGYWPIKSEPDLRGWLGRLHEAGAVTALPVVETRAAPLVFRRWQPGARMVRGHWNILVPPSEAEVVTPEVTLAPLVGWDGEGYRLGYGGGYFDRTLAVLAPRPLVIGVGSEDSKLNTIYPQPHDVPMDVIVTEAGRRIERAR